jgi:sugar lactone lactonase YvrE
LLFPALFGCRESERAPVYEKVLTFAGIPKDGGKAVIKEPFGLAFNSQGVLFISDGEAGKIWQANKTGALKLVTAKLDTPSALAFDKSDNLYAADSGAHAIKKINIANGETSVIAGVENQPGFADGDAQAALFNAPVGIAIDENGKIFVADTYNDRIRVIENGKVSTLAGGERGFADADMGPRAKFDTPCGIAVTKDGNVLVADTGNGRLRLIARSGRVTTLAGGGNKDALIALPNEADLAEPMDVKIDGRGVIYVADAVTNTIYALGRRVFPSIEKLTAGKRGLMDGGAGLSRFNRPTGMAFDAGGKLFIADSENQLVRVLQSRESDTGAEIKAGEIDGLKLTADEMREAAPGRWCYDPPERAHEIAGTLGEIRGEAGEGEDVWFHNGLDVVGGYGDTARFVRSEKVLRPFSAQLFNTLRESLRLPTLGYVHLRLGRDQNNNPFADPRFLFSYDQKGKMSGVRIRRGTKFAAGEPIGTLNSMNHVHLIAGRSGNEINALSALTLPGIGDSIAPVIEEVRLYDANGSMLDETQKGNQRINVSGDLRIVARSYDRMNGNADRRRLGVYRLGYAILHDDGSPVEGLSDSLTTILFDKLPDAGSAAARLVYADGSKSGAAGETIFNYIVTDFVQGGEAREDFFDTRKLPPGDYTLRVTAADFFDNQATKDIKIRIGG